MTNSKIKNTWTGSQLDKIYHFSNDRSLREDLFIGRLEKTLGKPKQEVVKLISKDLLNLLTSVPFNTEKLL